MIMWICEARRCRMKRGLYVYININLSDWASAYIIYNNNLDNRHKRAVPRGEWKGDNRQWSCLGCLGQASPWRQQVSPLWSRQSGPLRSVGYRVSRYNDYMKLSFIRWDNSWDKNINPQHNIKNIQKLYNVPSLRFRPCSCPLNHTR